MVLLFEYCVGNCLVRIGVFVIVIVFCGLIFCGVVVKFLFRGIFYFFFVIFVVYLVVFVFILIIIVIVLLYFERKFKIINIFCVVVCERRLLNVEVGSFE